MQDNRRPLSLLVIGAAVVAVYFVSSQFFGDDDAPDSAQTQTDGEHDGEQDGATEPVRPVLTEAQRLERRRTGTIVTDRFEATVDNLGGGISELRLIGDARFRTLPRDGTEREPIDVVTTDRPEYEALRVDLARIGIPEDATWELTQESPTEVSLSWEGNGVRVRRTLSAGEGPYQVRSRLEVTNTSEEAQRTRVEMSAWHYVSREEEDGGSLLSFFSRSPSISQGVCIYDDETERKDRKNLVEEIHGYGDGDVHIAAVENVYFTIAMAAAGDPAARCAISASDRGGTADDPLGTLFRARLIYPWTDLDAGEDLTVETLAYLGPKDPVALDAAGHQLPEMINLGFFSVIARQLAKLLSFIHQYIPNWGLAIICLTFMIRLVLFPLTNLSFKSMARMRRLKPEVDRINELYRDDPEKKGAAVMELYRKHKVNPLSGCLPMLVQMPVWFALYTSLSTNIELYHMPFIEVGHWLSDLSAADPYYVLPLLLGVLMHVQQRLNPAAVDPMQAKMMMYFMPIMITSFMLAMPAGLCVYMLTNSALGIAQQKFNEWRLGREVASAPPPEPEEASDDSDESDDGGDGSSGKPDRRRPKRKRRVRRGRA